MTDDRTNEAFESTLRVLYRAGIGVSPGSVAANLAVYEDAGLDEPQIRDALEELEARNLVNELDGHERYYQITDHGRDHVRREFGEDVFGYVD